ncbi:hypothetical protein CEXT_191441 [Caerostris extrusa]|uniref:Uncharacterized protein n=1 Tax=Caerostris extrusa TaxID=172846 RepID=A0AAV4Y9P9_CAEEX|nr:hypothetical protein CEXT_191441 [Caerostris extrusa]
MPGSFGMHQLAGPGPIYRGFQSEGLPFPQDGSLHLLVSVVRHFLHSAVCRGAFSLTLVWRWVVQLKLGPTEAAEGHRIPLE